MDKWNYFLVAMSMVGICMSIFYIIRAFQSQKQMKTRSSDKLINNVLTERLFNGYLYPVWLLIVSCLVLYWNIIV